MKRIIVYLLGATLAGAILLSPALAATSPSLYFAGWLPYWLKSGAAQIFTVNAEKFKEMDPFSYSVNPDGSLTDNLNITQGSWLNWVTDMKEAGVKVIPTVSWQNGTQIYNVLSSPTSTAANISALMALANTAPYSGLNIDYEDKTASTEPFFSSFIETLSKDLHADNKTLVCSIEPRTPIADAYYDTIVPAGVGEYSNNYTVLNKYCDEVDILAYDQDNVDLQLDDTKGANGALYMPIADPAWVSAVIQQTIQTISPSKILLGIPTYGYEYAVTQSGGETSYNEVSSLSYQNAIALAQSVGATPTRNSAGELSFTYGKATTSTSTTENFVDFTDATSIEHSITLAKQYKLKGVILFDINPGNDPASWSEL